MSDAGMIPECLGTGMHESTALPGDGHPDILRCPRCQRYVSILEDGTVARHLLMQVRPAVELQIRRGQMRAPRARWTQPRLGDTHRCAVGGSAVEYHVDFATPAGHFESWQQNAHILAALHHPGESVAWTKGGQPWTPAEPTAETQRVLDVIADHPERAMRVGHRVRAIDEHRASLGHDDEHRPIVAIHALGLVVDAPGYVVVPVHSVERHPDERLSK